MNSKLTVQLREDAIETTLDPKCSLDTPHEIASMLGTLCNAYLVTEELGAWFQVGGK